MIQVNNLSKSFAGQALFDNVTFSLNRGDRVGLIGRNGSGKSTLFKIILGQEAADEGGVAFPKNYRVGHLEQHLHFTKPTIVEEAAMGLKKGEEDHLYKVESLLMGLGFKESDLMRAPQEFSGGFQIRINLAKLLVSEPDLLLLDEPTNYLDIISVRFMIRFLKNWKRELILITHDRGFMDQVTTHTMGFFRGKLRRLEGPTEKLYALVAQDEELWEKTRLTEMKKRKQLQTFIDRFGASATKAKQAQSKAKFLEKMGEKEELSDEDSLEFNFPYAPLEAKTLVEIKDLSFAYPGGPKLFEHIDLEIKQGDCVGILGQNGRGKSTLLSVITQNIQPLSGQVRFHPRSAQGFFGQTNIDRLNFENTIEEEIHSVNITMPRARVRTICGIVMFEGDLALKKIKVLSGGERARVMLGKILMAENNLLFLDEPTNHLDIESVEGLCLGLENFPGGIAIVTHNEMMLRRLCNKLVVFNSDKAEVFLGTYDEFIAKFGFSDERASNFSQSLTLEKTPALSSNHHQQRKEEQKKLEKVKREKIKIEKRIDDLENENKKHSSEILLLSNGKSNFLEINRLQMKIDDNQKTIDQLFDELCELEN